MIMNSAIMTIWNVELGLAIHIKTPNGKNIVIDLGSTENFSPLDENIGYESINYLVITHPHLDHFSDIVNLRVNPDVLSCCRDYTREELLTDIRDCDKATFQKYCDLCDRYSSPVPTYLDPEQESTFAGVTAKVFQTSFCDKSNINNHSLIVVIKFGTTKIIVCGDNETDSFKHLMQDFSFKEAIQNADILIAAHHGRKSGFHESFVQLVNPKLTVISDTAKGETSSVDAYTKLSRGHSVYDPEVNQSSTRYCLTTRNDGNIKIRFFQTTDFSVTLKS